MLNFIGTKIILKGLNVYSNESGSFADAPRAAVASAEAQGIACIDGKMGKLIFRFS